MTASDRDTGDSDEASAQQELPPVLHDHLRAMLNDPQIGGIQGLARRFFAAGLGRIMASWIGVGPNQPISAPQIQRVLGSARLEQVAARLGTTTASLSAAIATSLPTLIDTLTPNGQLPPFPLP